VTYDVQPCFYTVTYDVQPCFYTVIYDVQPCFYTVTYDVQPCFYTVTYDVQPCFYTVTQSVIHITEGLRRTRPMTPAVCLKTFIFDLFFKWMNSNGKWMCSSFLLLCCSTVGNHTFYPVIVWFWHLFFWRCQIINLRGIFFLNWHKNEFLIPYSYTVNDAKREL